MFTVHALNVDCYIKPKWIPSSLFRRWDESFQRKKRFKVIEGKTRPFSGKYIWSGKGWAITLYVHMDVISSIYIPTYSDTCPPCPCCFWIRSAKRYPRKCYSKHFCSACLLSDSVASFSMMSKFVQWKIVSRRSREALRPRLCPIMISQQRVPKEMQWLLRKRMAQTKGKKAVSS